MDLLRDAEFRATNSRLSKLTGSSGKKSTVSEISNISRTKHTIDIDGYEDNWSETRQFLGKWFSSTSFDAALCGIILTNMALLVVETDQQAQYGDPEGWVRVANYVLIGIYIVELFLRLYVYRGHFFTSFTNWADLFIIISDVTIETVIIIIGDKDGVPSIVVLRIFRLLRLGRTHRALTLFPELHVMVMGLAGAFRAIFWGMILLLVVLMTWGILAVQIIHPLNQKVFEAGDYGDCDRCPRAFASVPASMLTFTQHIIAGDSWGAVSIPIIEAYPETYAFFFMVLVSVGMAILNLILAVVIDSAAMARKESDHQLVKIKDEEYKRMSQELLKVCEDLDKDGSGSLSLKELMNGYRSSVQFRDCMAMLDITQEDMSTVFQILDEDRSGDVRYEEFVQQLYKMKANDSHTLLVFIRYYVTEIRMKINEELRLMKSLFAMEDRRSKTVASLLNGSTGDTGSAGDSWRHEDYKKDAVSEEGSSAIIDISNVVAEVADIESFHPQRIPPVSPQRSGERITALLEQVVHSIESHGAILQSLSSVFLSGYTDYKDIVNEWRVTPSIDSAKSKGGVNARIPYSFLQNNLTATRTGHFLEHYSGVTDAAI